MEERLMLSPYSKTTVFFFILVTSQAGTSEWSSTVLFSGFPPTVQSLFAFPQIIEKY